MAGPDDISELEQAVIALIRQAYARGEEAAVARIVEAARGGKPVSALPVSGAVKPPDNYVGPSRRAPKGSLDPLLEEILQVTPGLTTNQIEHVVHERDQRIAIKSIYNRLRHCERNNEKFQRQGGKWYLRPPSAAPQAPVPPVPVPPAPIAASAPSPSPIPPAPLAAPALGPIPPAPQAVSAPTPSPVTIAPLIVASTPAAAPGLPPPVAWGQL